MKNKSVLFGIIAASLLTFEVLTPSMAKKLAHEKIEKDDTVYQEPEVVDFDHPTMVYEPQRAAAVSASKVTIHYHNEDKRCGDRELWIWCAGVVGKAYQPTVTNEGKDMSITLEFTGEMDLAGHWEDEVSKRASMDVTANEDGSYNILVHWGGSATETAIWEIHGTYDPVSGMLSYEDGAYSIHTVGEDGKETVSGEETTKGTFMKEGNKLRWSDSKNSDDGLFVKAE